MKSEDLKSLVEVFQNARAVEVTAAQHGGDNTLTLTFSVPPSREGREPLSEWKEITLAMRGDDIMMLDGDLEDLQEDTYDLRGRYNRIKNPEDFTVEELKKHNLPLYWNEKWIRAELTKHGSYAEVARVHGFNSPTTIASYAKRKFGIEIQGRYDKLRAEAIKDHKKNKTPPQELATKYKVSVATIYRWLNEGDRKSTKKKNTAKPEKKKKRTTRATAQSKTKENSKSNSKKTSESKGNSAA